MILGMAYLTTWVYETLFTVRPVESKTYVEVKIEDETMTLSKDGEIICVLSLDQETGRCALQLEEVVIRECGLGHLPIALPMYLYCRLLGVLWGVKASPALKNTDPLPANMSYIVLYGRNGQGTTYAYQYMLNRSGQIIASRTPRLPEEAADTFSFTPQEYLDDPEGVTIRFFDFFKDIGQIERVGKG